MCIFPQKIQELGKSLQRTTHELNTHQDQTKEEAEAVR